MNATISTTAATTETTTPDDPHDDEDYEGLLAGVKAHHKAMRLSGEPLFTTDAAGLFDAFLAGLPAARRQHYTCNACRRFVERFGGLVAITPNGTTVSPFWDDALVPTFFLASVRAMGRLVARAKVTGVFLSEERTWGLSFNRSAAPPGGWHHLAVVPEPSHVHVPTKLQSTDQRMAELREDHGMATRALAEFSLDVTRRAHAYLAGNHLFQAEKVIGPARWFLELQTALADARDETRRDNLVWLAISTAPIGFAHVKTTMIGSLLDDLTSGMSFEEAKRRFEAKMDPRKYARPVAPPAAGNVREAERIVATLGIAPSLRRRFAQIEEVTSIWTPKASPPPVTTGGVFGHVQTRETLVAPQMIELPSSTMTWVKFRDQVLPTAEKISFFVPAAKAPYGALITAADPKAPPILQWDRPERRNPVSWYVYPDGSPPGVWNLSAHTWVEVKAIALQPSMWDPEHDYSNRGKSVFLLLRGARDTSYRMGAGFFLELLRSELHPAHATLEAYVKTAVIEGAQSATACGVKLEQRAEKWINCLLRVTSGKQIASYVLDRWD
jgi:hypothetical protein